MKLLTADTRQHYPWDALPQHVKTHFALQSQLASSCSANEAKLL
jgi:hypothetical protein